MLVSMVASWTSLPASSSMWILLILMRFLSPPFREDVEVAVYAEGLFVLRDLVALRQVGIEIIFAGENAHAVYLAVRGEARLNGEIDDPLVEHGQRAGQAHADRARVAVRVCAELGRAAAENLAFREKVRVHLQPYDAFKTVQ